MAFTPHTWVAGEEPTVKKFNDIENGIKGVETSLTNTINSNYTTLNNRITNEKNNLSDTITTNYNTLNNRITNEKNSILNMFRFSGFTFSGLAPGKGSLQIAYFSPAYSGYATVVLANASIAHTGDGTVMVEIINVYGDRFTYRLYNTTNQTMSGVIYYVAIRG